MFSTRSTFIAYPLLFFFSFLSISFSVNTEQLFPLPSISLRKKKHIISTSVILKRLFRYVGTTVLSVKPLFYSKYFLLCSKLLSYIFLPTSWQYENGGGLFLILVFAIIINYLLMARDHFPKLAN